jgi:hypothetical protein
MWILSWQAILGELHLGGMGSALIRAAQPEELPLACLAALPGTSTHQRLSWEAAAPVDVYPLNSL